MLQAKRKFPALYAKLRIIQKDIYEPCTRLEAAIFKSAEPVPFSELNPGMFRPVSDREAWGRQYACAWLRLTGTVPKDLDKPYLYIKNTGESLLYTEDGVPFDAVTFVSTRGDLPQSSGNCRAAELPFRAGETFTIYLDCGYNGFIPMDFGEGVFRGAWVANVNAEAFAYYYDYLALLLLAGSTEDEALERTLTGELKSSFNSFKAGDTAHARALLGKHLKKPSEDTFTYTAVGHGHLDLAWLWPIRETVRKAARTYSIALKNIEKYPWYLYGTSQPQQLIWMKEQYPAVFERVKKAIKDGRIEAQGGFFAECDTNLPCGESLIRQALYGLREWDEFGERPRLCWLPDAFGYSGNLPQILKKCGMDYFSTIKLSWNKVNVFPYRTFYWHGIDNSSVLVHMPPEGDYNSAGGAHNLLNGKVRYPEKELGTALLVYGSGDGGGGPAERHIELVERERGVYGLPKVKPGTAIDFFDALANKKITHSYTGELYLETHQGTYTTQGKNKYYNRLGERLLHEAEAAFVLALGKADYPRVTIDNIWREILLYQFHDIIPGSSIGRVYKETTPRYHAIEQTLNGLIEKALSEPDNAASLCAVNLTSFKRDEFIKHEGKWYRACVPPYAIKRLEEIMTPAPELACSENTISNGLLNLTFGGGGEIVSCVDRRIGRELSGAYLNRLMLYQDRFVYPFNAWDIDQKYYKRSARVLKAFSSEAYIEGMRAVRRSVYKFGRSRIEQDVILDAGSDMVRFETRIEWHETFRMLRADFEPADFGDKARFEIQFGSIERATTERDSVEKAQFEVCAHKYVSVEGEKGGFALLNDCKYGHRVKNSKLSLNLLRSPVFPDPRADKGEHRFTYAFCPFDSGDHVKPVRAGYMLNNPLRAVVYKERESLVCTDNPGVVIETVKRSEDGRGVAVRLYEALGVNAKASLLTSIPYKRSMSADMLERPEGEIALSGLTFTPYEVKTILLLNGGTD
jgi:alpha-mannosidase